MFEANIGWYTNVQGRICTLRNGSAEFYFCINSWTVRWIVRLFDREIILKLWFLEVIVFQVWAMDILPCSASIVYYYFWKVAYLVSAIPNTTCLQLNSVKLFHSSQLISFFKLVKSIPLLRCINFLQINVVVSQLTLQQSSSNMRTNMIWFNDNH